MVVKLYLLQLPYCPIYIYIADYIGYNKLHVELWPFRSSETKNVISALCP